MSLLLLDVNALACILSHLDTPQDLLRVGRTCQRLHSVVQQAAEAWQRLCVVYYPQCMRSSQHPVPYMELFKDRWIKDAKEQRLQRKVLRMRLQSDAAQLQRELHQLHDRVQAERKLQQSLEQQLREVRRARLASDVNATRHWQLGAVQLYHNRVVQAAPVRLETKLSDLQQQQKVSHVQLQTLRSSMDLRRQRLADTKRRLKALEG